VYKVPIAAECKCKNYWWASLNIFRESAILESGVSSPLIANPLIFWIIPLNGINFLGP